MCVCVCIGLTVLRFSGKFKREHAYVLEPCVTFTTVQSDDATNSVEVAIDFFKRTYPLELGDYEEHDIFYIVDRLDHHLNDTHSRVRRHDPPALDSPILILPRAIEYNSNTDDSTRWSGIGSIKRKVTSNSRRIKRSGDPKISSHSRQSDRELLSSAVTIRSSRAIESSTDADVNLAASKSGHEGSGGHGHLAHELLEIAHIFHFISIAILGVFVVQVIGSSSMCLLYMRLRQERQVKVKPSRVTRGQCQSVVDPDIRLEGHIMWRIQTFGYREDTI